MLHALSRVGLRRVAEDLGKDETTVGRMRDQQFPQFAQMLASMGLKVVPTGYQCVDADTYKVLKRWAIERLSDEEPREERE